jgi:hypothetical protein
MTTRFIRTACILALFTALAGPAFGYDILLNTDFSDGTAHWKDDPNATACLIAQPTSSGVQIPLNATGWSKISQRFETPNSLLALNVTYAFSDDATFTPNTVLDSSVVQSITGVAVQPISLKLRPGDWVALIVDPVAKTVHYVRISSATPNPKSVIAAFSKLMEHEEKNLYLIFPPGTGSVTISHASLEKSDSAGSDGD